MGDLLLRVPARGMRTVEDLKIRTPGQITTLAKSGKGVWQVTGDSPRCLT